MKTEDLYKLFQNEGQEIVLEPSGHHLLREIHCLYFIESGSVNLFVSDSLKIENEAGVIQGPLVFLCDFDQGNLLFPFRPPNNPQNHLAIIIPVQKTVMKQVPFQKIKELLLLFPELQNYLSIQYRNWCSNFLNNFINTPPSQFDHFIKKDAILSLKDNQTASFSWLAQDESHRELIWLKIIRGKFLFLGMKKTPLSVNSPIFPLCSSCSSFSSGWLRCENEGEVLISANTNWASNDEYWEGIFLFNRYILELLSSQIIEEHFEEKAAFAVQLKREREWLQSSLNRMQKLFFKNHDEIPLLHDENEGLIKACQIIGKRLHQPFATSIEKFSHHPNEQVRMVASDSSIFQRKVFLSKNWWKKDCGLLLGRFKKGSRFTYVVLIPNSTSGYTIVNPTLDEKLPLDESIANHLDSTANMFYRSLPYQEKLTNAQLLNFSLKDQKNNIFLTFLAAFMVMVLALSIPILSGLLFDYVIPSHDASLLWQVILAVGITAIGSSIFILAREMAILRLDGTVFTNLECALWQRLFQVHLNYFRNISSGDLLNRMQGINVIRTTFSSYAIRTFVSCLFACGYLILMFFYIPFLALLILIIFSSILFISLVAFYSIAGTNRKISATSGILYGKIVQTVKGITKIRTNGAENRIFSDWNNLFLNTKKMELQRNRIHAIIRVIEEILPYFCYLCIFLFIINMINKDSENVLSPGYYIAFTSAFMSFFLAFKEFNAVLARGVDILPFWERSKTILEAPIENTEITYKNKTKYFLGEIRIDHLYFRYDAYSPYIHQDISMHILPGEFIAIVGHSGCGKSSLVRLLLGFEKPEQGAIYYDGWDLNELNPQDVRKQIGVVFQSSQIIQGTIRENVAAGRDVTDEEIMKALITVNFEQDLAKMPMGLRTPLIGGGTNLSGGQRQRLILARAILCNPKVLILDEATSALNNITQEAVSKSLHQFYMTRIVIAHRLSTIRNANRIYVMDKGKIVQEGSFEKLLNEKGLFAEFIEKQKL